MAEFIAIDPGTIPIERVYGVIVASVQPRPIAFVSTLSRLGVPNLAPFSFFMAGGANPPSLVYSPSINSRGGKKDSLTNVEQIGEFVVNAVTREMADGMNAASFEYPDGHSEWGASGFTPVDSEVVTPARVAESPIHFECKLFQIVEHGSGPSAARYVIGEVVRIHILENLWDGLRIDASRFRPISRLGGSEYLDTNSMELFSLTRPTGPVGSS